MHDKTSTIIKNLGFGDDVIKNLSKEIAKNNFKLSRKTIRALKKLGIPKMALAQIKLYESLVDIDEEDVAKHSNKDLIEKLFKKTKRSLNAFAKRKVPALIIFSNHDWVLYAESFNNHIRKFHSVCKPHFDSISLHGPEFQVSFDGKGSWSISTKDSKDIPNL